MKIAFQALGVLAADALEKFLGATAAAKSVGGIAGAAISTVLESAFVERESNLFPVDFQYVVTGMRRGLLSVRPENGFQDDVRNAFLSFIDAPGFYPEEIVPPSKLQGAVFGHFISR